MVLPNLPPFDRACLFGNAGAEVPSKLAELFGVFCSLRFFVVLASECLIVPPLMCKCGLWYGLFGSVIFGFLCPLSSSWGALHPPHMGLVVPNSFLMGRPPRVVHLGGGGGVLVMALSCFGWGKCKREGVAYLGKTTYTQFGAE